MLTWKHICGPKVHSSAYFYCNIFCDTAYVKKQTLVTQKHLHKHQADKPIINEILNLLLQTTCGSLKNRLERRAFSKRTGGKVLIKRLYSGKFDEKINRNLFNGIRKKGKTQKISQLQINWICSSIWRGVKKRSCIFMKYMCFLCPKLCQVFYICYAI